MIFNRLLVLEDMGGCREERGGDMGMLGCIPGIGGELGCGGGVTPPKVALMLD